jgi:hypothetical protein
VLTEADYKKAFTVEAKPTLVEHKEIVVEQKQVPVELKRKVSEEDSGFVDVSLD